MAFLSSLIRKAITEAKPLIEEMKGGATQAEPLVKDAAPEAKQMALPAAKDAATMTPQELMTARNHAEMKAMDNYHQTQIGLGRNLTPEQSQQEWIRKYSPTYPQQPPFPTVHPTPDMAPEDVLNVDLSNVDSKLPWQPNFDRMQTTDDVKALIGEMSDRNAPLIQKARRDVITNDQLQAMADELDTSKDVIAPVLARESGGTLKPETILAARQVLQSSANNLITMAKSMVDGSATDETKLRFARQIQLHREFQTQFMGARAETGRALNAFGIPSQDNPAMIKNMGQILDTLDGSDLRTMAEGLSHVDSVEGVNKVVSGFQHSKALGVLQELFVSSILSGVKTQVVNASGNALFMGKGLFDTALAAQLGRFESGTDKVFRGEASAQLYGYISAFRDGMKMAWNAAKTGEAQFGTTKFQRAVPHAISSENLQLGGSLLRIADLLHVKHPTYLANLVDKATDVTGNVIRAPMERGMEPVDVFFKTLAVRGDMARQAYHEAMVRGSTPEQQAQIIRDFMNQPSESAIDHAKQFALYETFQDQVGPATQAVKKALAKAPVFKFVVPFLNTPARLMHAGFNEMTPLGFFSNELRAEIQAGGARRDMALAKMAIGTALCSSVALSAGSGMITGAGPSDPNARRVLEATGWQPYSIRIENPATGEVTYHSYARMDPLSYVIGATADLVEMHQWNLYDTELKTADQQQNEMAAAIVAAIAQDTMSKTYLSGIADFSTMLSDPQRYYKQWAQALETAMVPFSSFRRDLGNIQDPILRQAWTLDEKLRANSGIPGWSEDIPAALNIYGEQRLHPRSDLLGVLSPYPTKTKKIEPVRNEVVRLMLATKQVPLTLPQKYVQGESLTSQEYHDLINLSRNVVKGPNGMTFNERLRDLVSSDAYKTAPSDYARVLMLKDVQHAYDEAARQQLLKDNPDLAKRVLQRKVITAGRLTGQDAIQQLLGGGQ